ncbi:aspartyl protease family protein [Chryseobacterium sp. JJR-5R]|uniref:aspartyl protease family protein n=1 Tax=Chryseobacterium sp. JJR-5R TaxID=3093923 RepID=UPI002A74AD05|nr:aspartyl protease family protein [Chryseobacterium sp. JJR-5R]WPO81254.1 aspartyl protease family protein [Chryseobacterium sp. JJR-5R]
MRKILYSLFICSAIAAFAQEKKFFEKGEVQLQHPLEKVNLRFENNLPFVKVDINGKMYNFLFDTGAPTVISQAIYKELNLKKKYRKAIRDSDQNVQQQILTELPEMKVDRLVFKNIGAIVIDLNSAELGCLKVDGIIGANQMAKLFWKINYSENSLEASKDLSLFDLRDYGTVIPFEAKPQKTPMVSAALLNREVKFTFDTGFSGRLETSGDHLDPEKFNHYVKTFGTRTTGAFGTAKPVPGYIFRADSMKIGNTLFQNERISSGKMNLAGNEFFKDFIFVIDWRSNKIYMKRIGTSQPMLASFGFSYRFADGKASVTFVFEEENFPLKIGDSIVSINGISLENLDQDQACYYFINRIEKDQKSIDVRINRDGKILDFKLSKKEYLK